MILVYQNYFLLPINHHKTARKSLLNKNTNIFIQQNLLFKYSDWIWFMKSSRRKATQISTFELFICYIYICMYHVYTQLLHKLKEGNLSKLV